MNPGPALTHPAPAGPSCAGPAPADAGPADAGHAVTGIIFDIQRGAFHDGPGLRTTVFLKGCPLRCLWCHNPESWSRIPPQAAPLFRERRASVGEILGIVRKDRRYHDASGGGLTLSGGEPSRQLRFCLALLRAARAEGIHTALDTCGCAPARALDLLAPHTSLFLWDYKATDTPAAPALHRALTGRDPGPIPGNFRRLYAAGAAIILRCPLVPGLNDTPAHLEAIARLARDHPRLAGVEIIPYHDAGLSKYDRLGLPRPPPAARPPGGADKIRWRAFFQSRNLANITVT
ncbi:MAG: radical SAM protein [Opitutaceae bacterium]|jgi:pyruvate formate lyase activating enzyme|nr:radical SAM protein [Opitutaceae bacterium]